MQHMADAVSHDQNFKNLIVDYPREALAFFAAEEAPRPEDDVRIVPVRQEQLKERLGDRYRALDAPLLVDWADGRRDAVVFALEEESDWRRFSPHRLARYCLDLAEMFDTDRVVPVAIFLRAADRAPASLVLGTGRRHYLVFDYLACKLAEMPAGRWLDSDNLVARVNLPNMRSPARDRVDVYARAVHGLLTLETDGARQAKYMEFIDIYAGLTDNEFRRYRRQHPQESSIVTGLIQRARAEGIERGMERGIERGMERGIEQGMERGIEQGMERGIEQGMERASRAWGHAARPRRGQARGAGATAPAALRRAVARSGGAAAAGARDRAGDLGRQPAGRRNARRGVPHDTVGVALARRDRERSARSPTEQ